MIHILRMFTGFTALSVQSTPGRLPNAVSSLPYKLTITSSESLGDCLFCHASYFLNRHGQLLQGSFQNRTGATDIQSHKPFSRLTEHCAVIQCQTGFFHKKTLPVPLAAGLMRDNPRKSGKRPGDVSYRYPGYAPSDNSP